GTPKRITRRFQRSERAPRRASSSPRGRGVRTRSLPAVGGPAPRSGTIPPRKEGAGTAGWRSRSSRTDRPSYEATNTELLTFSVAHVPCGERGRRNEHLLRKGH